MVIKSYVAPSVAGALKMIRAELGSKAVVLKTRGLSARESGVGRRMVEITACLEKPTVGALSATLADPQKQVELESSQYGRESMLSAIREADATAKDVRSADNQLANLSSDIEDANNPLSEESVKMENLSSGSTRSGMVDIRDVESFAKRLEEKLDLILDTHLSAETISEVPAELAPLARMLVAQDIPERFWRPILKKVSEKLRAGSSHRLTEYAEDVLVAEFADRCEPEITLRPGSVALFVGPAGCGKTSVLGKVAVDLLFKKRIKTELSTLDDFRVAAQEEIISYGEALGATFVDPDEVESTVTSTKSAAERVLLVDCHSNINDQRQFMRLKKRAAALRPTSVFLIISALMRSADVSRLVRRFELLNPTHIIATHTDLTDTIGGLYTAAVDSGVKLCALTNSPGSIGDLLSPDPAAMARSIVERSR
jgi:flagellar biosynthesis protein FlhF